MKHTTSEVNTLCVMAAIIASQIQDSYRSDRDRLAAVSVDLAKKIRMEVLAQSR